MPKQNNIIRAIDDAQDALKPVAEALAARPGSYAAGAAELHMAIVTLHLNSLRGMVLEVIAETSPEPETVELYAP